MSVDKNHSKSVVFSKNSKRPNASIPKNNRGSIHSRENSAERNLNSQKFSKKLEKIKSHKKNAYSMPFHDPTQHMLGNIKIPISFDNKKATMTPDISTHNSKVPSRN